jgi:hypothetical protein
MFTVMAGSLTKGFATVGAAWKGHLVHGGEAALEKFGELSR